MSRRETFLESARVANDEALATPARESEQAPSGMELRVLTGELRQIREGIARLEAGLQAAMTAKPREVGGRRGLQRVTWALAGALLAILVLTLARPDWALRPRQRADLALGERMHRVLETMEEGDRSEVLGSLWASSSSPPATTD